MKIAFIGQKGIPARFGGVETHVEAIATRLAARGHEVDVFVRNWYTPRTMESYRGVRLRHLPTLRTKHLDASVHSLLASLGTLAGGYDLLHYHATGPGTFAVLPWMFGRPVVLTVHGVDWQREKWAKPARVLMRAGERLAVRSARRVIAVTRDIEDYLRERYRCVAVHIPNGVEPGTSGQAEGDLRDLGLTQGGYVLFLGRFVPEKRLDWLVEAFERILPGGSFPGLELVLAGSLDTEADTVRFLLERADGLPCRFPGPVGGATKTSLLRGARLAVLPSSLEGQPIFLLEAMANGVPCLASDIAPHRTLLGEGRGMLFDRDSREDLTKRLVDALTLSPEERRDMTEKAREYVGRHHDWDLITDAVEAVYRDALAGETASP